ncbi:protein of unknown function [Candidatus Nitrospira inopinata]|uniref:Uncharacterized protein n=1 Tax=Candidatus Nitrospira inopinata TaxID=1715989 RepID=A0A0S4KXX1_9BACT|nr:protein of unknown function [Candidatus Nitrospira inopinata]
MITRADLEVPMARIARKEFPHVPRRSPLFFHRSVHRYESPVFRRSMRDVTSFRRRFGRAIFPRLGPRRRTRRYD